MHFQIHVWGAADVQFCQKLLSMKLCDDLELFLRHIGDSQTTRKAFSIHSGFLIARETTIGIYESIPENLTYPPGQQVFPSTYDAWSLLLDGAAHKVELSTFYWNLLSVDPHPSSWQGREIYSKLASLTNRSVQLRIAQNLPFDGQVYKELEQLAKQESVEVRFLNFTHFFGAGVQHSKLWIVDDSHFYIGSANMDWKALTQVKEIGLLFYNCHCMAKDIQKSFESSPQSFCPEGRTDDMTAILDVIDQADRFVCVSVMSYLPLSLHQKQTKWWPVLDDALRRAAFERHVHVRLLGSLWKYTPPAMLNFLRSMKILNGTNLGAVIEVRIFQVPSDGQYIPYTRVNHAKFMVTEKSAYVGTSNWVEDYFSVTSGLGVVIRHNDKLRQSLEDAFMRDWDSVYSSSV